MLQNHNHLVARMPGVDGMKTGYTSLAGFNLVASGVRNNHRLITVVLGGPSVAARDENVEELLDAGFNVLNRRMAGQRITIASIISEPDDMAGPVQRAPIEEGSADQPNLQVEVQAQQRTLPVMAAAQDLSAPSPVETAGPLRTAAADCAPVRHGRRRRHASVACAAANKAVATAAVKPTAPRLRNQDTAAAEPAPCPAHGRRRHHAACTAPDDGAVKTAAAKPDGAELGHAEPGHAGSGRTDGKAGGYLIQVGAYKNHTLAKTQVDSLAALVSGAGEVDHANGNYRARFRGLSEKEAKAACHSLSAKGHSCLVMAAS